MFYIITKRTIGLIFSALLCIIIPLSVGISYSVMTPEPTKTIVIDAGHGGVDEGVFGVDTGVPESELNLIISKMLREHFKNAGYRVVMTRSTSEGLYGIKSPGFKSRDMNQRKQIIQNSDPDIVVSIHMNRYTSPIRRGLQVFYSDRGESMLLAEEIQRVANANLNKPYTGRNLSTLYGDYYILKCTTSPSVIVECGFLSNPEDEALLIQPEYQQELAYYIFSGIISYIKSSEEKRS